jgi:hypothetical protein
MADPRPNLDLGLQYRQGVAAPTAAEIAAKGVAIADQDAAGNPVVNWSWLSGEKVIYVEDANFSVAELVFRQGFISVGNLGSSRVEIETEKINIENDNNTSTSGVINIPDGSGIYAGSGSGDVPLWHLQIPNTLYAGRTGINVEIRGTTASLVGGGIYQLIASSDGLDCNDRPLHNFHDYERSIAPIGTGASLVTVWSHALADLVSADGKIRRIGIRVTFRNNGSGVADIRDLEFEIERAGGSYYLHNVTADTVGAADSAITNMVTGRRSGISINWSLGFDGSDLVFQVLQTGTDRDVGVVVWWDEERG